MCECLSQSRAPWRVQSCLAQECIPTGCQEKGDPYICYLWSQLQWICEFRIAPYDATVFPAAFCKNRWFNSDRCLKAITTSHSSSNLSTITLITALSVEQLKAQALSQESRIQILAFLLTWVKTLTNALKCPTNILWLEHFRVSPKDFTRPISASLLRDSFEPWKTILLLQGVGCKRQGINHS